MDKRSLSERDICTKFITPALERAGWDIARQIREEVSFTKGRVIVRGKMAVRGKARRADYVLSVQPNIPLAVIEAKDNRHAVADGLPMFEAGAYDSLLKRLEHADLRELEQTIVSKALWPEFEPTFRNKETLAAKFRQLADLRNGIAHNRSVDDVTRQEGDAATRWFADVLGRAAH